MAGETQITIVGNLVADPELRFTNSGRAVANFRVASTPKFFDKSANQWVDGEALFLMCNVWGDQAENVTQSLEKGMRVIVQGKLTQRSYETREGEKRTVMELAVDEIGPSLRFVTVTVNRNTGDGYYHGMRMPGGAQTDKQQPATNWNTPSNIGQQQQGVQQTLGDADEPPF